MSVTKGIFATQARPRTPASDIKKLGWRGVMRTVGREGRVPVTDHGQPEAVILSTDEYQRLVQAAESAQARQQDALQALRQRFDKRLATLAADDTGARLRAVLAWFNPDAFARECVAATGCKQTAANARVRTEGMRRLDATIAQGQSFAAESTLGGRSVPAWLLAGSRDIREAKIRARWRSVVANLIALLPHLAEVRVFDNSTNVAPGQSVPDPVPVAVIQKGRLIWPAAHDTAQLARTPDWAKPVLEAGLAA